MKKEKTNVSPMRCVFSNQVSVVKVQQCLIETLAEIAGSSRDLECHIHTDRINTVYSFIADGVCATLHIQPIGVEGGVL